MFGKITAIVTRFALRRANLSILDRHELYTLVLQKIVALPLHDIIKYNEEGKLLVNGQTIDIEMGLKLRDSARVALSNYAHEVVYEQVMYKALESAAYSASNPVDLYFFRAATWWGQEEVKLLQLLAGDDQERDLTP